MLKLGDFLLQEKIQNTSRIIESKDFPQISHKHGPIIRFPFPFPEFFDIIFIFIKTLLPFRGQAGNPQRKTNQRGRST